MAYRNITLCVNLCCHVILIWVYIEDYMYSNALQIMVVG